jgi:hypothetical protein
MSVDSVLQWDEPAFAGACEFLGEVVLVLDAVNVARQIADSTSTSCNSFQFLDDKKVLLMREESTRSFWGAQDGGLSGGLFGSANP